MQFVHIVQLSIKVCIARFCKRNKRGALIFQHTIPPLLFLFLFLFSHFKHLFFAPHAFYFALFHAELLIILIMPYHKKPQIEITINFAQNARQGRSAPPRDKFFSFFFSGGSGWLLGNSNYNNADLPQSQSSEAASVLSAVK